ncbi:MarR family winged helix-turn-helix transcriptional regulator [Pseudomonas sp. RL_15y_Pfl2_60]|uniref:MarR family winged helix-turn-helix transcriptional regulator n=1 Tax=Pseudomonas sp. RL_15y_Pfl2_60 TaxID=3088709 RepID=UPI0030D8D5B6
MSNPTPPLFPFSVMGLLIGRTALLKDQILDRNLVPYSVTAAQFKVLIMIAHFGVDTPAELCRQLSLDSGAMTRMLDRLEHKQLVIRRRCADDRRQVRLALAEDGQALANQLPRIGADAMDELLGVLEPEERAMLERILKKILFSAGDTITMQRLGDQQ